MKIVIQRVSEASVKIDGSIKGQIRQGLLVFVGIVEEDTLEDIDWLIRKLLHLRIFADENLVMNKSVLDIDGEILVISQFTLHASTKKGNRPSYIKAGKPAIAIPLYNNFISRLESEFKKPIASGTFGADMKVSLINDGPVTIIIDSKNKQ